MVVAHCGSKFGIVRVVADAASSSRWTCVCRLGGVYIVVSVFWLWLVDGVLPDRWDLVGTATVLVGAAVIYFAPRDMTL